MTHHTTTPTPEALAALEPYNPEVYRHNREQAIARARLAGHTWREISQHVGITEALLSKTYKHLPKGDRTT